MAEIYPHPKMNLRQRVENFWYHYRCQFLFGLVVVIFIGIALVQSFLKKDPDVSFLYVGPVALGDTVCNDIVSASAGKLTNDLDGKDHYEADIRTIQLSVELDRLSPHQKNEADKAYQRYVEEILSGDDCFLLLAPEFYERLDRAGALMSLYEIYGEWREEGSPLCGIPVKDIPLGKSEGFRDLPGDTLLCLKYAGGVNGKLSEDEIANANERNAEIYRALCS